MAIVTIRVAGQIAQPKKEELIDRFTTTVKEVLGKNPEAIHVLIEEVAEENWGLRGKSIAALHGGK